MSFQQLYFSFNGRISRQTYWINGVLVLGGIIFFGAIIDSAVEADGSLFTVCFLLLLWPSLAVQVKRWHDRDKEAAWLLLNIIPIVGPIWSLVELGFLPGTPTENRFGVAPM